MRRSIPHFYEENPPRPEADLWAYMVAEDIGLGILPDELGVRLEPPNSPSAAVVLQLFPTRDGFRASLEERVTDFIEETTQYLAREGELWYEIVRRPTSISAGPPPFVLASLPPGNTTQFPGRLIQHVPRASRPRVGRRYIVLPLRDAWHITLPPELGSPGEHRSLLRLLGSSFFPPAFSVEAMEPGKSVKGYDFTVHRQTHQAWIAAATRRWGWTGRGMWAEEASAYFLDYRALRFRRAQVLLRGHIINEMNALIHREGIDTTIVTEELTSVEMIDAMLARIKEGTATSDDALYLLKR